jgi:hypothetical protein
MSGKGSKGAKDVASKKLDPRDPDLTSEQKDQIKKDQDDTDRMLGNGKHARDPMTGLTQQLAQRQASKP